MVHLKIGQAAPDFTLPTTRGDITLSKYVAASRKGVIVYFYPKASTPGCTTEACDFRDRLSIFSEAGFDVLGVSADKMPALEKFTAKHNLSFPLASDPDRKVLTEWGVWGEKMSFGRKILGAIRSTFVVDKNMMLSRADYNVRASGHVGRIQSAIVLGDK